MSDDPAGLAYTAVSMSDFGSTRGTQHHPWWALARGVEALMEVATDESQPLQKVATVALQIMATAYNERVEE